MHLSSYQDHMSITIEVTTNCFLVSFPPHLAAAPLRPEAVTKPLTTWWLYHRTSHHVVPLQGHMCSFITFFLCIPPSGATQSLFTRRGLI